MYKRQTNSPLPFNMWIQLVETAEEDCNVKVTIEIDINPFMKAMVPVSYTHLI